MALRALFFATSMRSHCSGNTQTYLFSVVLSAESVTALAPVGYHMGRHGRPNIRSRSQSTAILCASMDRCRDHMRRLPTGNRAWIQRQSAPPIRSAMQIPRYPGACGAWRMVCAIILRAGHAHSTDSVSIAPDRWQVFPARQSDAPLRPVSVASPCANTRSPGVEGTIGAAGVTE